VPAPLVGQWHEELASKFGLDFAVASPASTAGFWERSSLALASLALAKSRKHFEAVTARPWDLVIVDEAHHCKNRSTRNWQLVNALQRRHLFLLTATPVQNDLLELYNLLTLLEPGHLKTEHDFRRTFIRRGQPRDPRNRERLRSLLGEVMIRNTRSLVTINLPPRYAQTLVVQPSDREAELYRLLDSYVRWRCLSPEPAAPAEAESTPPPPPESEAAPSPRAEAEDAPPAPPGEEPLLDLLADQSPLPESGNPQSAILNPQSAILNPQSAIRNPQSEALPPISRMQVNSLLLAAGSHPAALQAALEKMARGDYRAGPLAALAARLDVSAKEHKLLDLLRESAGQKVLVFANFRATLDRLSRVLSQGGFSFCLFHGSLSQQEKQRAIEDFSTRTPILLCSDSGGEGHNLQFANTLINFDLPWNPMRIEQRVGRLHRIGQTREVFVFNLCTAGSLEERILGLLHDKIRMFELVVGEVGSILGNLEGGEEFESLVLDLWMRSRDPAQLDRAFQQLGESLLAAQEQYLQTKELDEALFGEDYE